MWITLPQSHLEFEISSGELFLVHGCHACSVFRMFEVNANCTFFQPPVFLSLLTSSVSAYPHTESSFPFSNCAHDRLNAYTLDDGFLGSFLTSKILKYLMILLGIRPRVG